MPLQKQPFTINFGQGLDTKTDKFQVSPGKFLSLENSVFDTTGQLKKRDGFPQLTTLPNTSATTLTTFKESLVAVGANLSHLASDEGQWFNRGSFQPVDLSVVSVSRSSTSQSIPDLAVAPNGFGCSTWKDSNGLCYYKIFDTSTGQSLSGSVPLLSGARHPRVCLLGRYFVVTYIAQVSTVYHLYYVSIPYLTPNTPASPVDLTAQAKDLDAGYDVVVANNNMYWAINGSDVGGAIRIGYLDSGLLQHTPVAIASATASMVSLCADTTGPTPVIYLTSYLSGTATVRSFSPALVAILSATTAFTSTTTAEITSAAKNSVLTLGYQVQNTYSYSSTRSDYFVTKTVSSAGIVSSSTIQQRGVGLGSKMFLFGSDTYVLLSSAGAFQPTYFLWSLSTGIIGKLAYSNGGGYNEDQVLSSVTVLNGVIYMAYTYKDQIVAVNKAQGVQSVGGTFSQTGVNVVKFEINQTLDAREIGQNLHLTGGFVWMYDGDRPIEHGFHLWPEDVGVTASVTGGLLSAQTYSYQVVYTWTDNQGNIHRSAPSIPQSVTTTGATSSITVNVPTLRLTRKTSQNKVRIEVFRASTAQQSFYLVTSLTSPLLNDPTVDSVPFIDTKIDADIIGNPLIYTTGNVVENIAFPATAAIALFKSRLFAVSAEDENLIVCSKQVVVGVPAEPTDLFSINLNPTLAPQGTNARGTVLVPLDDKLIMMKSNSLFYITGTGPDNTGANNDFSEPVLITSAVGCSNKKSIAITPSGIMFQSPDKGIWLLGRDLATTYVGSGVEKFNDTKVTSALAIPGTNQVRFTLEGGKVLVFDYLMNQWGTCGSTINAISSTIYNGRHTYLSATGKVYGESPDTYLDGTNPVLMAFETSWFALAGLQGFQRFYELNLLGEYKSPHILEIGFSYNYDDSIQQTIFIYPDNYVGPYGADPIFGGSIVYGGGTKIEDWQIYPRLQKCESFKITLREHYDASIGVPAGAGLTISGLSMMLGMKQGTRKTAASNTAG